MSHSAEPDITSPSGTPEKSSAATGLQSDATAPDVSADTPAPSEAGPSESEKKLSEVDARFLRAFRNLTADEDRLEETGKRITLRYILGGEILSGEWFQKQIWYILMLVIMIIFYTSNRYACQQETLEIKALTDTLKDRRYKALTRAAQLKQSTRRSQIEQSLADTAIQTAVIPPYYLKIEEDE